MQKIKLNFAIFLIIAFILMVTVACSNANDPTNDTNEDLDISISSNNSLDANEHNNESDESTNDTIIFSILNKATLSIDKERLGDDLYTLGHVDDRWNFGEIEEIFNAIQGVWRVKDYVGFVASSLYYPELFDIHDNIPIDIKDQLLLSYEKKIEVAKENIPELSIVVRNRYIGYHGEASGNKYLFVNNTYRSPINIILSLDRMNDYYPVYRDQAAISTDFIAEYPVMYIKFFIKQECNGSIEYEPATLVITSDNEIYILKDGAFYSLEYAEYADVYGIT